MRRFIVPTLAALSVIWFATLASAQGTKPVRGTLTAMAADSVTVKVGTTDMKFSIDEKTNVVAPGAGTKTRKAAAAGKQGPKMSELLQTGDAVEVSYRDMAGNHHATSIRKVSSPGSAGVPSNNSNGTVTAVSPTSLTISGSSGGGATFTQTFAIDEKTKVIGKGAGTAAAKAGGRIAITDLIANGDQVSVSFTGATGALHASEVRVTMKK